MQKQLQVLCVSQFTLFAKLKGNKPDFHLAMGGDSSRATYARFLEQMKAGYQPDRIAGEGPKLNALMPHRRGLRRDDARGHRQ
jgi:D-Tyr-tRNAtyr deacylase